MPSQQKRQSPQAVAILGVASGLGQTKAGVERAPKFLRDAGFFNFGFAEDLGDIHPSTDRSTAEAWSVISKTKDRALAALQNGARLITIGGDHSIAAGTISATLTHKPKTRVVWIDAHGDMNTPASSPSGNLHGMPLAALLGFFKSPLGGPYLLPKNLLLIGVRDLDPGEKKFIKDLGLDVVTAAEIHHDYTTAAKKIEEWLRRSNEPVHLSFDVDSIDPSQAPATGLRVPDGLSTREAKSIVKLVQDNSLITAVDLVELNPLEAEAREVQLTLVNLQSILSEIPFAAGVLGDLFNQNSPSTNLTIESLDFC